MCCCSMEVLVLCMLTLHVFLTCAVAGALKSYMTENVNLKKCNLKKCIAFLPIERSLFNYM